MSEPSPPDAKQPIGTNWSMVYRRLEVSRTGLEHGVMPTREERQKILRARAQTQAREPNREEATEGGLEVVEFLLAYETYGVESSYIREVYPLKELTPLPCTPQYPRGAGDGPRVGRRPRARHGGRSSCLPGEEQLRPERSPRRDPKTRLNSLALPWSFI
jgi:hypothetical protein